MTQYTLSPAAQRSLAEIKSYTTKNHGARQARRYLVAMRDRMRALAAHPLHGMQRDDIKSGYFSYFQGSHTIYYYLDGEQGIAVIDILHQSMDPQRHLATSQGENQG